MDTFDNFSYKPGRTIEQLDLERMANQLNTSYTERFRKMITLIKISQKIKDAPNQKPNGYK